MLTIVCLVSGLDDLSTRYRYELITDRVTLQRTKPEHYTYTHVCGAERARLLSVMYTSSVDTWPSVAISAVPDIRPGDIR